MRRALLEIPGIELAVIAPDSNRSATARSITTRRPLWVEEVEFGDGTSGFATDGTPVDCVRFASLGLVEFQPELIVSGINHGSNLGDDITYSGTVAAALEGIVLGIPAIAVSQQADRAGLSYHHDGSFDFETAARFAARIVEQLDEFPLPPETLININVPAGDVHGARGTKLGKRRYNDTLELEAEERSGRKRTPSCSRPTRRRSGSVPSHWKSSTRCGTCSRCCRWPMRATKTSCAPGRRACGGWPNSRAGPGRSSTSPSRRSTAWRSPWSTRT